MSRRDKGRNTGRLWREPALEEPGVVIDLAEWRDGAADSGVVAMLRDLCGEPPYERVDWNALHASVTRGVARPLRWRRQRTAWLGAIAGWAVAAVPAGVLAGVATAGVLVAAPLNAPAPGAARAHVLTPVVLASVVTGAVSAQAVADSVAGPLRLDAVVTGLLP